MENNISELQAEIFHALEQNNQQVDDAPVVEEAHSEIKAPILLQIARDALIFAAELHKGDDGLGMVLTEPKTAQVGLSEPLVMVKSVAMNSIACEAGIASGDLVSDLLLFVH